MMPTSVPDMIPIVDSKMITGVAYLQTAQILYVEFANGSLYGYKDVPPDAYEGLMGASSKGSYFTHYIKRVYEYFQLQ